MSLGEPLEVDGADIAGFGHLAFKQPAWVDLHLADDQHRLTVLGGGLDIKPLGLEFTPEEISQALENVTGHGYARQEAQEPASTSLRRHCRR